MSSVANAKPVVDLELKKAFTELQLKMMDTNQKLRFADGNIETIKRSILHKKLTDGEIGKLVPDNPVYQGVGRCFFRTTIPVVRTSLNKNISDLQDKIKVLESNKEFLEKDIKNSENSLRELVNQKKNAL